MDYSFVIVWGDNLCAGGMGRTCSPPKASPGVPLPHRTLTNLGSRHHENETLGVWQIRERNSLVLDHL